MKFDFPSNPTAPTPEQLAEIGDVLVTGTELRQLYEALIRHPRVLAAPGSSDVFLSCQGQIAQDMALIQEQLGGLLALAQSAPADPAEEIDRTKAGTLPLPPRQISLPDVEPPNPGQSVFDTVRRAFHLEDFLLQQLNFSLSSAQQRHDRRLELQLKMILLSAQQRCSLLTERYGFARSKSVLVQEVRRQTTRLLARLQGRERPDID